MNDPKKTTLAAAVVGGYILGRTKKGKLALLLASIIAGRKIPLNPQDLITQGVRKIADTPQFRELTEQVRDELVQSGRSAARAAADRTMSSYADALHRRTEELRRRRGGGRPEPEGGEAEHEEPEGKEPEREEPEGKEPEREEPEGEEPEREEGEHRSRQRRTERRAAHRPHHTTPADRRDSPSDRTAEKSSHRTGHRR
ncbi:hypothetical protein [Streptomyces macrosporus]|uniref:DNA primase n=1 Tax=Streptomyces macrosporus TaxID=44032 RepID=A0ABN3K6F6_9ACTN